MIPFHLKMLQVRLLRSFSHLGSATPDDTRRVADLAYCAAPKLIIVALPASTRSRSIGHSGIMRSIQ